MSDLKELYETSQAKRPTEARGIPGQKTDFFDLEHKVSDGFVPGKKKGDPTDFNEEVIESEYETQIAELTPPPSFNPEQPLHRYNPKNVYGAPGQPKK